jgi:hypothetical protein
MELLSEFYLITIVVAVVFVGIMLSAIVSEILPEIIFGIFKLIGNTLAFIFGGVFALIGKGYTALLDKFYPNRHIIARQKRITKRYSNKPKWLIDYIVNKTIEVHDGLCEFFIMDNYEIKSRTILSDHSKYCEFMDICNDYAKKENGITDIEIINIGLKYGYMKDIPTNGKSQKGRVFNFVRDLRKENILA